MWIKPKTPGAYESKSPGKEISLAQTICLSVGIMWAPVGFFLRRCVTLPLLFLPAFQSIPILFLPGTKGSIAGRQSSRKDPNVFRKPMMPEPYPMCHEPIVALRSGNLLLGPTWVDSWAAASEGLQWPSLAAESRVSLQAPPVMDYNCNRNTLRCYQGRVFYIYIYCICAGLQHDVKTMFF